MVNLKEEASHVGLIAGSLLLLLVNERRRRKIYIVSLLKNKRHRKHTHNSYTLSSSLVESERPSDQVLSMASPNLLLNFIMFFMIILHPSFSSSSTSKRRAIYLPLTSVEPSSTTVGRHLKSKLPTARMPLYDDLGTRG